MARSLLRPLGHNAGRLNAIELNALWELAESPSDRVRLLFLEQALESPETARQLRNRAALALHAVVGLDRPRRQQVEERLGAQLRDKSLSLDSRTDLALVAAELKGLTPGCASEVARICTGAMAETGRPDDLARLSWALAEVAGRLPPGEAVRHCRFAARRLTEAVAEARDPEALARALEAVAGRLPPGEAVRRLTEALRGARTGDRDALPSLARALEAMAGRLPPAEAAAAARTLTDVADWVRDSEALARALKAVVGRLPPAEAAAAARALIATPSNRGRSRAWELAAVAGRLPPDEAARHCATAARKITEHFTVDKLWSPDRLARFAGELAAVAEWLPPDEAARHCATAARKITEYFSFSGPWSPKDLAYLAGALATVAGRLPPDEATRHCRFAARRLTEAMRGARAKSDPDDLAYLAWALAAVAGRLPPDEAAATARALTDAVRALTDAVAEARDPDALARALEAVARGLPPAEAAAATRALAVAMTKESHPHSVANLARALVAVSVRLPSADAARRARLIAQALGESTAPAIPLSGVAKLAEVVRPMPSALSVQDLVDLLKMPTCVGPARTVILEQLGQRCNRPFADQWAFVEYAHAHLPNIDLTTPPKRPTFATPR
jgi:hypothetical protein